MRSIQSRPVNQTILMVNRTFSIQQILFDSIQSIQSRVNQTPVCSHLPRLYLLFAASVVAAKDTSDICPLPAYRGVGEASKASSNTQKRGSPKLICIDTFIGYT